MRAHHWWAGYWCVLVGVRLVTLKGAALELLQQARPAAPAGGHAVDHVVPGAHHAAAKVPEAGGAGAGLPHCQLQGGCCGRCGWRRLVTAIASLLPLHRLRQLCRGKPERNSQLSTSPRVPLTLAGK
jgi:hypothetical protein